MADVGGLELEPRKARYNGGVEKRGDGRKSPRLDASCTEARGRSADLIETLPMVARLLAAREGESDV